MNNKVHFTVLEGERSDNRRVSEMYWARQGWTSNTINGSYVGCPELADGSKFKYKNPTSLHYKKMYRTMIQLVINYPIPDLVTVP